MATIFERISLICRSSMNDFISKFENPAKLIDQTIIDAKKELADSKMAAAEVFASEKKALADLDALKKEKEQYDIVAERAVDAGNDDDARQALTKAASLEDRITKAEARYLSVHSSADNLRAKLSQLRDGISTMEARAVDIKADMASAEATKKTTKITSEINGGAFGTFERLAEKAAAERMTAEAMAEYESDAMKNTDADLLAKYSAASADASVEEKLAALKAKRAGSAE